MMTIMFHVKPQGLRRSVVKVTRQQAAENRAAVVKAAGRLFRAHGFDGVGVAEITRAAGLTHGGFYGQFASKGALAEEACEHAFAESLDWLQTRLGGPEGGLDRLLDAYLSQRHRDRPGDGCPMAAYATEIARQDPALQERFAAGVARYVDALANGLPEGGDDGGRRRRAMTILAALVGGMVLARATASSAPDLAADMLTCLRRELAVLGDLEDAAAADDPHKEEAR